MDLHANFIIDLSVIKSS